MDQGNGPNDDERFWTRSSIRDMVALVVVFEFVAWLVQRSSSSESLLKHWPLVAMIVFFLLGLVWSISRIYRVTPNRQTPSIVVLIGSVLGLTVGTFLYATFLARGDW